MKEGPKKLLPVIAAYFVIYTVWGSTYFFIRMGVATIPPFHLVGWRFSIGGLFFLVLSFATGRLKRLPTPREWLTSAVFGIFLLAFGNGLVTAAETKVDSYLAALIIAGAPLAVALFDMLFSRKRLSLLVWAGILLGVAGVWVLLQDGSQRTLGMRPEILLVVGGLLSFSLATSLGHKFPVYPDAFVNSAIQMLTVGLLVSVLTAIAQPVTPSLLAAISPSSLFALIYLALIGSTGFIAYTWLVRNEPAIRVISYSFVNPVIAILLGMIAGKEKPMPWLGLAIPMILTGLFLMIYGDPLYRKITGKPPASGKVETPGNPEPG